MQLYDKDLLSMQEVRTLMEYSKAAQAKLAEFNQEQVDKIVCSIASAGKRNAYRLAKMAHEETGFGVIADKQIKNIFASQGVYDYIKDMKTVGIIARDEKNKMMEVATPVGIIAGLIPSTNPTSTVFFKAEIAIKSGNSIVFSPHPNAKDCIWEAVKVIRQAISEVGGPEDLVSCITIPTAQATDALMKHPDTAMILATGGSAMVRAAYSSGSPAIGVGPGNGPAYIDKSADIKMAVKRIMDSKTFDNGTICASEQSVITLTEMVDSVRAEMEKQGCYFLTKEQSAKLGGFILRANGTMNPQIVGKTAQYIATLAGIEIPKDTRVMVAFEDGVGRGHPYSNEKLCPILAFYSADNYVGVCQRCIEILRYEGAGHSFMIHTNDTNMVEYFAMRIPVSRILVNTAGALGGVGATTKLAPSFTLGCGAIGGSATSENVSPRELLNIKRVAYGTVEVDELREGATIEDTCQKEHQITKETIDDIVAKIIKKLNS